MLIQTPEFYKRDSTGNFFKNSWNFLELNYENKNLLEYLIKNMEYWIKDFNVDVFRCDVAGGVPVDLWEEARIQLEKIRPDIGMLAESNCPEDFDKGI